MQPAANLQTPHQTNRSSIPSVTEQHATGHFQDTPISPTIRLIHQQLLWHCLIANHFTSLA